MKMKITKEDAKEIDLVKAHYIAILDERESMNAYTINDVNRLCKLLEVYYSLIDDVKKRGAYTEYNNGGGQVGTRQNESIKLISIYEKQIEDLKQIIEKHINVNVKYERFSEKVYCDYRKFENYFTNNDTKKIDSETQNKELQIIKTCDEYDISKEETQHYISMLRNNEIEFEELYKKVKLKAELIEKLIVERNSEDYELVDAIYINENLDENKELPESIKLEQEYEDEYIEKLIDKPENKEHLEEIRYYQYCELINNDDEEFKKYLEEKKPETTNEEVETFYEYVIDLARRIEIKPDTKMA